ncbi:MAG: hypothetical protein AABX04_03100 [Nanoarchaeota archaeon]
MKERLEKILSDAKQFIKSNVSVRILATGLALGYVSCGGDEKNFSDCNTGNCCNDVYLGCGEACSSNDCIKDCAHEYYQCVDRVTSYGYSGSNGNGRTSPNGNGSSCTPNCYSKECGSNDCGGSCGSCSSDEYCNGGECISLHWNCIGGCHDEKWGCLGRTKDVDCNDPNDYDNYYSSSKECQEKKNECDKIFSACTEKCN